MSCIDCKHARKLVNGNRPFQVGCALAARNESVEEIVIANYLMDKEKPIYSMFYNKRRPVESGRGVMKRGILVSKDFHCIEYDEIF